MPQQYKIDKVAEIESRIAENAGLFVVNYNGLTVKQAQELRHQLRECGAEMKVYKNNLVKIALKNQEQPELDEILAGPVAYVFYESEPVEAAKALKDFSAQSKGVLEIKGGISDGKAVSADDVKAIAELPTKDQLLGQIAGLISGFARDIAVCVNGVSSWSRSFDPAGLRAEGSLVAVFTRGGNAAPLAHSRRVLTDLRAQTRKPKGLRNG